MRAQILVVVLLVMLVSSPGVATAQQRVYGVYITGAEQVPTLTTTAIGWAAFELTPAGLRYSLYAHNIENVSMAHIHIAPLGVNGPIVVWLYPSAPPARPIPGVFSGLLGEGTIAAANLTGPLAGQPLSALPSAIEAGNAYVNIHTARFPGGEIRGQIR
ncbi:MAG: CHRD domain-containing protein [bacterium]|nr:CHRD domain-containing protein [bacterium]